MFNSLDQKTTTYVLSGAGLLVTGTLLWRYRELLPRIEASWPAIGWQTKKQTKNNATAKSNTD